MRAVIQRISRASVKVNDKTIGQIGRGLLILLGVSRGDDEGSIEKLAKKVVNLRIFSDAQGKMNKSLQEAGGEILVVSQFTLLGRTEKGNRPSFIDAAEPEKGNDYYEKFVRALRQKGIKVETGEFGAMMSVSLTNDGPVTIVMQI